MQIDTVVLAGYSPDRPDPLAAAMGVKRKALIDIAGKPMIYWTVRALQASERVGRLIIVGLGLEDGVDFETDVEYIPNRGGQLDNVLAGTDAVAAAHPEQDVALLCGADIPLITPRSINWFVDASLEADADVCYAIVEKSVMDSQFPDSARSFLPLMEGRFCGGDCFMVRPSVARNNQHLARQLLAERKHPLGLARAFGLSVLLKFLFHRLTVAEGEAVASCLFGCRVRALASPYADLAMDIDKPHQLEVARRVIAHRLAEGTL